MAAGAVLHGAGTGPAWNWSSWWWSSSASPSSSPHLWWFFYPSFLLFLLVPLAILGLLVFVAARWWLARPTSSPSGTKAVTSNALAILQERYARGEITKEQFEQIVSDLRRQA